MLDRLLSDHPATRRYRARALTATTVAVGVIGLVSWKPAPVDALIEGADDFIEGFRGGAEADSYEGGMSEIPLAVGGLSGQEALTIVAVEPAAQFIPPAAS